MIVIESDSQVEIAVYPLDAFGRSDKAIWINTRWDTPEVRLPSLYDKIFLPMNHVFIDNRKNRLFISNKLMKEILDKYRRSNYQYKYYLPPPKIIKIDWSRWVNARGRRN